MKKAGLNVGLMYEGGGAGGTTANVNTGNVETGAVKDTRADPVVLKLWHYANLLEIFHSVISINRHYPVASQSLFIL